MAGRAALVVLAALAAIQATSAQQRVIDWAALPPLPLNATVRVIDAMDRYVGQALRNPGCPTPEATPRGWRLRVDLAVLLDEGGDVRTIVPRAINCPTVEQYAAGVAERAVRGKVAVRGSDAAQWYRLQIAFGPGR